VLVEACYAHATSPDVAMRPRARQLFSWRRLAQLNPDMVALAP
jgi:hypothetical protein